MGLPAFKVAPSWTLPFTRGPRDATPPCPQRDQALPPASLSGGQGSPVALEGRRSSDALAFLLSSEQDRPAWSCEQAQALPAPPTLLVEPSPGPWSLPVAPLTPLWRQAPSLHPASRLWFRPSFLPLGPVPSFVQGHHLLRYYFLVVICPTFLYLCDAQDSPGKPALPACLPASKSGSRPGLALGTGNWTPLPLAPEVGQPVVSRVA